ncbi:MAG: SMP-30/gluconolactonase/LRE family protein [Alphaproteobacteria bacterium]|nr:SMP-30/gluconolactonase/LRE family protein [Alphaproteobacteria bacterium]
MTNDAASGAQPILTADRASVFFDGIFSEPKLSHPEGVAIGPDGWVWTGNQDGDILRISPDGERMERVASTDGFALGLAFDGDRALFLCDLRHAAIFRYDLAKGTLERFTAPGIRIPNYPLVDRAHGRLLVSDSHASGVPGPGIWSYDLLTGEGELWFSQDLNFANGMAMRADDRAVYVCETFSKAITRIPVLENGEAGGPEPFAADLPGLPDGIAFDADGNLVVGCYEPSRLLRIRPDGARTDILIEDLTAHTFCHPTNVAFDGTNLYTANLGRWHIARVAMDIGAPPLWSTL